MLRDRIRQAARPAHVERCRDRLWDCTLPQQVSCRLLLRNCIRGGYQEFLAVGSYRVEGVGPAPAGMVRFTQVLAPGQEVGSRLRGMVRRRRREEGAWVVGPRLRMVRASKASFVQAIGLEPRQSVRVRMPGNWRAAPWVLYEPEQGMSEIIDWLCASMGFVAHAVARTGQVAAGLSFAVEGLGVTLAPANAVPGGWSEHTRRVGAGVFREIVAYSRQDPPALARRYRELLSEIELPLTREGDVPAHLALLTELPEGILSGNQRVDGRFRGRVLFWPSAGSSATRLVAERVRCDGSTALGESPSQGARYRRSGFTVGNGRPVPFLHWHLADRVLIRQVVV